MLFLYTTNKLGRLEQNPFTFLALGDSYTIGEGVKESERWPRQLVKRLQGNGISISDPQIVARTGWTTKELAQGIAKADVTGTYSIVSLLIGVNNQYRGYPMKQYEDEFTLLLDKAIEFAAKNPHNVYVLSIPDYGVTPFSKEKNLDREKIKRELHEYNAIAQKITLLKKAHFINTAKDHVKFENNPSLMASDGLHPSGKMYKQWVDALYNQVYDNLSSR